jgi:hypothetical protein
VNLYLSERIAATKAILAVQKGSSGPWLAGMARNGDLIKSSYGPLMRFDLSPLPP